MSQEQQTPINDGLESDFQKNGEPPSWAPDHPKYWDAERWKVSPGSGRTERVTAASATSDEKFLAIASERKITIYSTLFFQIVEVLETKHRYVVTVEFAPSPKTNGDREREGKGYVLASESCCDEGEAETVVNLWALDEKGQKYKSREARPELELKGKFTIFGGSVFSHDGQKMLYESVIHDGTGIHSRLTAIDVASGTDAFFMEGHINFISWVGFSPDDKFIASAAWDGYLMLYDGADGKHVRNLGPSQNQNWACGFSPDSNFVGVSGSGGDNSTFIWEAGDPQSFPVALKSGGHGWQRVISWSPDGKRIAIGEYFGRLAVFDARSTALKQVWQLEKSGGPSEVTEVKWLERGKRILFKPADGSIQMYDFEENKKWRWGPGLGDVWTPGAWFKTMVMMEKKGWFGTVDQDGAFRLWDLPKLWPVAIT